MLSGTGKHRRPRQAPAAFVTAGMTGAGIAIPLLGASGAQAADLDTWDRVAQCESDGLWSADTGNGYYGGLQLTQGLWEEYGGMSYADRPDLASRSQQIAVAEKILADRGPEAWPGCGINAGLRYDTTGEAPAIAPENYLPGEAPAAPSVPAAGTKSADGAPGKTEKTGETGETGKAGETAKTDGEADDSAGGAATESPGAETVEETGKAGTDPAAGAEDPAGAGPTEGAGKHRGERDPLELELEQQADTEGTGDTEGAADTGDAGEAADRSDAATAGGQETLAAGDYLVQPGDSLVQIAQKHELTWSELYESNKDVLGENPDLIVPGQGIELD
ncbi:transglycosylase domain-containing protein [Streptomyces carminius]|uniref:Transglycosylase domain-containing protein n=1 Tax=Streptomyces carminius TaxID=2665496 RepID=A0A2M8LUP9_9ACTN|nr:transglycosylase family protein [Streptomyces carminius]PJE95675.1 transglycosylase domain-containing protein [Streptomyces carminius]